MTSFVEQQVAPAPSELFQLLNDLKNGDSKIRAKTTRILQGKLKVRAMSTPHPDVIPLATELACGLSEPEARCACVGLLTNITPDGPVPAWLLTAMTDPHPWVLQTGLSAIHYFNGPELVEPIIQILSASDDMLVLENAATALAEIPDLRAVPALAAQLESAPPSRAAIRPHALQQVLQRYYVSVALGLARYGKHALSRLVPLLTHPDSNRRIAAIIALRVIGDVGTRDTVANLKSDLDAGVRQQAERCDKIWGDGAGFPPHIIS